MFSRALKSRRADPSEKHEVDCSVRRDMGPEPPPSNHQHLRVPDETTVPLLQPLDVFSGSRAPVSSDVKPVQQPQALDVYSGVRVPAPYALAWCGWRRVPPIGQQMVRDILETADASLWAIDCSPLTKLQQRHPPKDRRTTFEVRLA